MTDTTLNPYSDLPPHAFWRTGVADAGPFKLQQLWSSPWELPADSRFATFGSCFAQHISRALRSRGIGWINAEPAPKDCPADLARRFNYSVFSARTANIYTAAQLRLLVRMAGGQSETEVAEFWTEADGRVVDSLRPAIEPGGFSSAEEAILSRETMVRCFRKAVEQADVFVFTLGLTEGWETSDGHPLAACPGTLGGVFHPDRYHFVNYRSTAIREAMEEVLLLLQDMNPHIRLLLTVSPVPLTATASGNHVLAATTYSKSVLRAVAGEMAEDHDHVDYFPSYEVITGQMTRSSFYAPNLRSVELPGVEVVMSHFFNGLTLTGAGRHRDEPSKDALSDAASEAEIEAEELICEEAMLEAFNEA